MSNPSAQRAVVLLSGGLDSAVAAWLAQQQGIELVLALTVNYGQRAFPRERQAAQTVAQWLGLPQQVIELPWLADLLPAAMQANSTASTTVTSAETAVAQVWVPNRNGILLNIAAAYAEHLAANAVIFGANASEAVGFPDNSAAYVDATTHALGFSTRNQVNILAPVAHLSKANMLATIAGTDFPLDAIWSCYDAGDQPCGQCLSCQHRAAATQNTTLQPA